MMRLAAALLVATLGSAWILATFHDRSWWPPDDGQYAHVAERVLDGDVLHRDVHDPHADYGHFLNAAGLAVFGRDLVSLRYPLVLLGGLNALLVFALLWRRSVELAACAALAVTALGFVQFPNPSPNWYGLSLTLGVIACLSSRFQGRILATGFVLGLALGTRQLTGILVSIGAVSYLMIETRDPANAARSWVARGVLLVALLGLSTYLALSTDLLGWVLFGIWPVGVLCWCLCAAALPDRVATGILLRLLGGAAAALVPALAYHASHGSLGAWSQEVFFAARDVPDLGYLADASFGDWLRSAGARVVSPTALASSASAVYWLVLIASGATNGALMIAVLLRSRSGTRLAAALPFIACFHALVSVFNQIPIYLYYGVGLSLAGIAWTVAAGPRVPRVAPVALGCVLIGLTATGVRSHAGQPHTRAVVDAVAGTRVPMQRNARVPRASLWMEPDQERLYGDLVEFIHATTNPADTLLAVPNNAELYFLAQRPSAVDFWSSALALRTRSDEQLLIARLRAAPPALILHAPRDKSSTDRLRRVLEAVRDLYESPVPVHYFQVWQRKSGARGQKVDSPEPSSNS